METLIDRKKLHEMIPLSERTVFNLEKRGEFPKRVEITTRKVAWKLSEIQQWISSKEPKSSGSRQQS